MVQQLTTRTRTVNPAFLQEIKDSNPNLWETVTRVRGFSRRPLDLEDQPVGGLIRMLNELRDHLALQFSLEECYGYLEGGSASIVMDDRIHQALEQHRRLYLLVIDLCDFAEDLQYRGMIQAQGRILLEHVRDFDRQFSEHECLEREIMELAYYDQRR